MKPLKPESILVIPNFKKKGTPDVLKRVCAWCRIHGVKTLLRTDYPHKIPKSCREGTVLLDAHNEKRLLNHCGLILTIGGDGTMIRGAAYASDYAIPITGVNTGTLGFLADIFPSETEVKLNRLLHGDYVRETRRCIAATWDGGEIPAALNDIVLQKTTQGGICAVDVYYGEERVGHYRADGLILSTPTGSTGYAYAAGGPIIHAGANVISVIPLCPQYRMNIPLVCTMDQPITIVPVSGSMHVTADGTPRGTLKKGRPLSARYGKGHVDLIRFSEHWGVIDWMERVGRLG